jgi:sugar diacid utilization regulator
LEASNAALKASIEIHRRLTEVAVSGERLDGIARAVHELTGLPVAIEDRHGNLQAWAGPPPPQPYPKDPLAQRERLLERLRRTKRPVRVSDRILALAQPRYDIIGILALFDPSEMAGEQALVAIEHGATVLAMELARLRSLAEAELRLGRDLVEELLAGTDEESALAHAQALGYDLKRPYHVVVVERGARDGDDELFFHAVRRAAGNLGVGSLLVARARTVVVLADAVDVSWPKLQSAVLTELGGGQCRIGVGGRCDRPADFPRSYREAQLALKMQEISGHDDRVTSFEDLGVYRILSQVQDPGEVERFARQRLELLIEYDEQTGSDLVMTLMTYLACGGSHTRAAQKLNLHRSTLKYRIRRIHEISGHDLGDPEVAFDLALATRAWAILRAIN